VSLVENSRGCVSLKKTEAGLRKCVPRQKMKLKKLIFDHFAQKLSTGRAGLSFARLTHERTISPSQKPQGYLRIYLRYTTGKENGIRGIQRRDEGSCALDRVYELRRRDGIALHAFYAGMHASMQVLLKS
jgi:hypothetical protein